jgi:hypothetical protein
MSNKKKTTTKKADTAPKATPTPAPKAENKVVTLTGKEKVAAIKKAHLEAIADLRAQYKKDVAAVKR